MTRRSHQTNTRARPPVEAVFCILLVHVALANELHSLDEQGESLSGRGIQGIQGTGVEIPDSTKCSETWRPWVSIGSPFLLNLGAKVNLVGIFYFETSFPMVINEVFREGYFSSSLGVTISEGGPAGSTRLGSEASVMVGVSAPFFGDNSAFVGIGLNFVLRFGSGFCMFLRPAPVYFFSRRGGIFLDLGFGWNF